MTPSDWEGCFLLASSVFLVVMLLLALHKQYTTLEQRHQKSFREGWMARGDYECERRKGDENA